MKTYVAILRHNNVPAMEEQGTATLDVLPHTVLAEIASRCSPRDACALSLVSRPLRAAVSGNDYFWGACVSRRWGKGRTPRDGDGREPRNDFHSRHSRGERGVIYYSVHPLAQITITTFYRHRHRERTSPHSQRRGGVALRPQGHLYGAFLTSSNLGGSAWPLPGSCRKRSQGPSRPLS